MGAARTNELAPISACTVPMRRLAPPAAQRKILTWLPCFTVRFGPENAARNSVTELRAGESNQESAGGPRGAAEE
jgi:hypothetical protein